MENSLTFHKKADATTPAHAGTGYVSSSYSEHSGSRILPSDLSAQYQQALAFHQQNRFCEAESLYRQILNVEPNHPGAFHFLGMSRYSQGNPLEAISFLEQSLRLCSTKPVYFNNYGVVLKELKRYGEAKDAFEKALLLNPDYADALSNLGLASSLLEEPDHIAEYHLRTALRLQPNHRDALRHLTGLLLKNERHEDAIPLVECLAALDPNNAEHVHQLGCLYGSIGEMEKAKTYFQKASSMPGGKAVWKWKHLWYCPVFFENEEGINAYWNRLNDDLDIALTEQPLYDWRTLVYDGFTHSFNLPHLNRCCKGVLEKFTRLFAPSFPFERPTYQPGKKIRVGFLVTPGHEGGFLRMVTGLMERLDPEKFEPVLFYNETTKKRFEGRFQRSDLTVVPYSWNFEEAVRTIRDAKCDVLYYWKVGADVWNFFLPMCRLAPVQCTTWSTHGTSGVPHVDYYVTWDKAEVPDSPQEQYTETLYFLDIKPYFEPLLEDIPPPSTRTELGLPETGAVYFCPHRPPKYHPIFDDYLKGILEKDTSGHLVLLMGLQSQTSDRIVRRMKQHLGSELFQRVIVLPKQHVQQYYRYLSVATVVLNSPVYEGEITAVDAFLYGVPLVTQTGDFLFQRYTSAFYDDFGIDGPACATQEDYIAQAVKLGTDPMYREEISQKIMANRSRFFENEYSIREWERFFEEVTREHPADKFHVSDVTAASAVPMQQLEINVAYGCNLKCNHCSHFCDRMSGLAPVQELFADYRTWHSKLAPERIRLIGGEPLLHPELALVIRETKRHWPKARIDLVTNGLLLPQRLEILTLLKELGGYVFISRHFGHAGYLEEFHKGLQCLQASGVGFTLYTSDREWRKYYEPDADGTPVPCDSDPEKAWRNCQTKNLCPTLWDNRLWKCQHLAWSFHAVNAGKLPESWLTARDDQSLPPESTSSEIMMFLATEAVPGCRICPETYERLSLPDKFSFPSSAAKPDSIASS